MVVSRDTLVAARLSHQIPFEDVTLHGRSEPLAVTPLNAQKLRELLTTVDLPNELIVILRFTRVAISS
jgi:hypothetical protein